MFLYHNLNQPLRAGRQLGKPASPGYKLEIA